MTEDFNKFARSHGINSVNLHNFQSIINSSPGHTVPKGSMTPYIIEERKMNITQMDVFSRLMAERTIFMGTQVDSHMANIIVAQLLYLDSIDPGKDIQMYVNSPGGGVYAGLGIYDTMQFVKSDVSTTCTGLAASMGAIILAGGAAGKRTALPHSRIMIHQPLGGAQGQASDIQITAREIQKLKDELYLILSSHSGQDLEKIEKDSDRDYWMTAAEAAEYKLIDSVITRK